MVETQLFFIATSKVMTITSSGAVVGYDWGDYGDWVKFATPPTPTTTKVTYNKTKKNAAGASILGGNGGVTVYGTSIPANASKGGVSYPVRYWQRGYTVYTRTSALTKQKKMQKSVYTPEKPYQYRLQYKNKPVIQKSYTTYSNGTQYVYFADRYYDDGGAVHPTNGNLLHPYECSIKYVDCRKNIDTSNANNNDSRNNNGEYVLSNVRANIVELTFKWAGLSPEDASLLLDVLCPVKSTKGEYPYLQVQYLDATSNKPKTGTFFASDRSVTKYPNGYIKELSVTLTEV